MRRITRAAIVSVTICLSAQEAFTQSTQFEGKWRTTMPGKTFPISVTVTLGPGENFFQEGVAGPTACDRSWIKGTYVQMRPNVFRFKMVRYGPEVDCSGKPIRQMPGWTGELRLISPNMMTWYDPLTKNQVTFHRLR